MQETPDICVHTLFYWCNDILAIQHFYTDLIGLKEEHFRNEVCYS